MSVLHFGAAALTGLGLAACVTSAAPATQTAASFSAVAPFSCRIEAIPRAGQTEVRASISAHAPVSGLFWLDLAQQSAGGSSNISQSGPFSASAGETLTLGSASFGGAASALRGRMVLTWQGGEVRCPVTAPIGAL
ncbi:curli-like amyloid fiber formation chaperone CsgH [Flavimaricola marinus]|uniref:CsgH-like domain-containing protein n=1 Tax=Flavimaricola marinus TaxID=1819565 RepID=A0A238LHA3_9RHOB|nr:curli-like amyloid fiber formation chaperone CsgH [Flavimaricola marinus]SMY08784.1 hypothetical protein LOM8899_02940 [Flavimaricola marinus]